MNMRVNECQRRPCLEINLVVNFIPHIPHSEIAATYLYGFGPFGGSLVEKLSEIFNKIFWHFRSSLAPQNDPPKYLPKFLRICHSMSCG